MAKAIIFDNGMGGVAVMRPTPTVFVLLDGTPGLVTPQNEKESRRMAALSDAELAEEGLRRATASEVAEVDVPVVLDSPYIDPNTGDHIFRVLRRFAVDNGLKFTPLPYSIVDEDEIPEDRYFRQAWEVSGYGLNVNMDNAREIHMDEIRKMRNAKLKELDIATLSGKNVEAEKQILRDIPQTFDLSEADTTEELRQLWPEQLT